jgi:predicted small secreted protein
MKRKNQRILLLLALAATLAFALTSCNIVDGTYKTPKAIEKWWNDQQP